MNQTIRKFKYEEITLENIDINDHLDFKCDGDKKEIIVEAKKEKK